MFISKKTITWLQTVWKSVTPETIKDCFKNMDLTLKITQMQIKTSTPKFRNCLNKFPLKTLLHWFWRWDCYVRVSYCSDDVRLEASLSRVKYCRSCLKLWRCWKNRWVRRWIAGKGWQRDQHPGSTSIRKSWRSGKFNWNPRRQS